MADQWDDVDSENIVKWDMAETAKGGPFPEMLDGEFASVPEASYQKDPHAHPKTLTVVDIFVNCIYLATPIPKFLTNDFIKEKGPERRLTVVVDVSCE